MTAAVPAVSSPVLDTNLAGVKNIPLGDIAFSPTNPRKHFDPAGIKDLADSILSQGLVQPIVVRANPSKAKNTPPWELVAGERRTRAAREAGLTSLLAVVRALNDVEVLELQVAENAQRTDLHPLEEADGYARLIAKGQALSKIAERAGRTPHYIHDRVKLLQLTKLAQELFLAGKFTLGHAILLARLNKHEQEIALDPYGGGLFELQKELFGGDAEDEAAGRPLAKTLGEVMSEQEEGIETYRDVKPVSVREFQGWIDKNIRFDDKAIEPLLFPEAAQNVAFALEEAEKVVHITYLNECPQAARGEQRTFTRQSWERADGQRGSAECPSAVVGVVVVGPGRGDSFKVCVSNQKCRVHFAEAVQAKEERKAAVVEAIAQGKDPHEVAAKKPVAGPSEQELERQRYKDAMPALFKAFAAAVKKASTSPGGPLGTMILEQYAHHGNQATDADRQLVPLGRTAEDLVRRIAFLDILETVSNEWDAPYSVPGLAKKFGIDLKKVMAPAVGAKPTGSREKGRNVAKAAKKGKSGRKAA